MDVRPLKTEADYDWALAEAGKYFASEPARGTPEGDRFEILLLIAGGAAFARQLRHPDAEREQQRHREREARLRHQPAEPTAARLFGDARANPRVESQ